MMQNNLLHTLLEEFAINLPKKNDINQRNISFPSVENKIISLIGMRRTGKTYYLYQKINELLQKKVKIEQILYINFEDERLSNISKHELGELLDEFYSLYPENYKKKIYIFLDEIQNVDDWGQVVRRFFDKKNTNMAITGSSAKLLSKEIATSLRGRCYSIEVWPYSFAEFLKNSELYPKSRTFGKVTLNRLKKCLQDFLLRGGFPEVSVAAINEHYRILQDYVEVVTYRDIVERHNVTNISLLKYVIKFLVKNTATRFSINKMYNDLKSQGFQIGRSTLYDYISYIEDSYLCFFVSLYSESLRKSQVNEKKIYVIDTGVACSYMFGFSENYGRLFETLVYIELRRREYNVFYYFTKDRYEIDFLVETPERKRILYQVVWDVSDKKTLEREQRALNMAKQELNIEGFLITPDVFIEKFIN